MSRIKVGLLAGLLLGGLALGQGAGEVEKPAEPGTLVVIDAAGKEHTIKSWKFALGTRRLGWLAPPADKGEPDKDARPKKDKAPAGPEALVIRDEAKFAFATGVLALVPLDRIRSVAFDADKSTMTVRVATSAKPEEDAKLVGSTAYKGINKVTLEAEVDKGAAGVAELTFQGGVPRGIKGIRFPAPQVEADKPGRPAVVVAADKDVKRAYKVTDLMPVYRTGGGEKVLPTLMFKKTLKVDVTKVQKIVAGTDDADDTVWQVVQKDGDDSTLTLLQTMPVDGQPALLLGLLGKVPEGYRLFPVRRIVAVHFDTTEEPKEKEKDDGGPS
jgi:hypothetical protein